MQRGFYRALWAAPPDHLGLEQADDGLGKRVIVGIPDTADRRLDTRFEEPLGVPIGSTRQIGSTP